MYFLEKVKTVLQNLENPKVHLKDPIGPNEGPWLVMDPVGGSSCVPRVPWYDFWCLYGQYSQFFPLGHLPPPPCLFKDSKMPAWLGLIRNKSNFKSKPHHSAIKWWLCKQYVCLKIYIVPLRQFINLTMYLVLHQNLVRISNQNSNSIKLLSSPLLQTISHWLNFEFYIQGRNFSNILYRGLTGEGTEYLM